MNSRPGTPGLPFGIEWQLLHEPLEGLDCIAIFHVPRWICTESGKMQALLPDYTR